mmetsp:Transcript_45214/g.137089  ORF Transcript_45214/g.137089 Transcript_45214/m.137089 type:complete len:220 (-) Transcript_45214:7-666(-)
MRAREALARPHHAVKRVDVRADVRPEVDGAARHDQAAAATAHNAELLPRRFSSFLRVDRPFLRRFHGEIVASPTLEVHLVPRAQLAVAGSALHREFLPLAGVGPMSVHLAAILDGQALARLQHFQEHLVARIQRPGRPLDSRALHVRELAARLQKKHVFGEPAASHPCGADASIGARGEEAQGGREGREGNPHGAGGGAERDQWRSCQAEGRTGRALWY